jgi:hypothetical protein
MLCNEFSVTLAIISVSFSFGCGASPTVPPKGLKKPPAPAVGAAEDQLEIRNVIVTITLPNQNPKKSELTGTAADDQILQKLPALDCRIECEISPDSVQNVSLAVQIEAPYAGYARMAHGTGAGVFQRKENGKFLADVKLAQPLPLEANDKATIVLTVNGNHSRSKQPFKFEINDAKIIIEKAN